MRSIDSRLRALEKLERQREAEETAKAAADAPSIAAYAEVAAMSDEQLITVIFEGLRPPAELAWERKLWPDQYRLYRAHWSDPYWTAVADRAVQLLAEKDILVMPVTLEEVALTIEALRSGEVSIWTHADDAGGVYRFSAGLGELSEDVQRKKLACFYAGVALYTWLTMHGPRNSPNRPPAPKTTEEVIAWLEGLEDVDICEALSVG